MDKTPKTPQHWRRQIQAGGKPAYVLIADLIAEDIRSGRLGARDQLPTLRELAQDLGLNYTTVARGYAQARKRGLIDSHVGIGTVVRGAHPPGLPLRAGTSAEMTMNLPPEPPLPALLARLQDCAIDALRERPLYDLLRYQDFGGSAQDREAGVQWLRPLLPQCTADQVLVAPGIHGVLLALLSQLARPGGLVCVEALAYPGLKAIAAQLGVQLHALPMDDEGVSAEAFEHACKTLYPKALVCNPAIHNPTTVTMSRARREAIADVALRYSVPLVEDDAYGRLARQALPTLTSLAPELTYYVTGLSKSVGAGLRTAYVCTPSPRLSQRLAGALRATAVMTAPFTNAIATRWVQDGGAAAMLQAIRDESMARQALAAQYLADFDVQAQPEGFHLWLRLPAEGARTAARHGEGSPVSAVELAAGLRAQGVAAVGSAAFSTDGAPPEAIRLCLGGSIGRDGIRRTLGLLAERLAHPHHPHGGFL